MKRPCPKCSKPMQANWYHSKRTGRHRRCVPCDYWEKIVCVRKPSGEAKLLAHIQTLTDEKSQLRLEYAALENLMLDPDEATLERMCAAWDEYSCVDDWMHGTSDTARQNQKARMAWALAAMLSKKGTP